MLVLVLPSFALLLLACEPEPSVPRSPAEAVARAQAQAPDDPRPASGPMDFFPARRTLSPSGAVEVHVGQDRALRLVLPQGDLLLDAPVDPRVAFSPDEAWLYYARDAGLGETEIWRLALPSGSPQPVVQWRGNADRPVLSPDGRRLAFVSGTTGLASFWMVPLDGPLPVPIEQGVQLSNKDLDRIPGQAPEGFLPPPTTILPRWDAQGLSWSAQGKAWRLEVGP
jgi:hypothetical protein